MPGFQRRASRLTRRLAYYVVHATIYVMTGIGAEMMTSTDAARVLGVTVRQVQRFAESGQLATRGSVGRTVLLDTDSVHRLATVGTARGRAWKADTVWTAMAVLDGRTLTHVTDAERANLSRLRNRLRHMDADQLVRMARRRAEVTRWRVAGSYAAKLTREVLITGSSALDTGESGAALGQLLGLSTSRASDHIDGYVTAEQVAQLKRRLFLVADGGGNVTLRVTDGADALADRNIGYRAALPVVALDLAEALDVRERAAGLRTLTGLLERA